MDFAEALVYLDGYTNRGVVPGIDRMRWLCEQLGHPEHTAPAIHLTGTNGKGSTARLVAALLQAAGRRPGLYTSPHLVDITERVAVDGRAITQDVFAELMGRLAPLFDRVTDAVDFGPTHFEILTTIGLQAFADAGVDALVVEVGLGGRWDSTNVVDGSVAVVTNIDLDHTSFLGASRRLIAEEKAGIIKPGAVAVIGETDPSLLRVLVERCEHVGATPWTAGRDFALLDDRPVATGRLVTVRTPGATYEDVRVPFHGAHQSANAACALAAVEAWCGAPLDPALIGRAWRSVDNPGRFEVVDGRPPTVIDAAHNPHGVAALRAALDERFPGRPCVVVFGANPDKDIDAMLQGLAPRTRMLVATQARDGDAVPAEVIAKRAAAAGIDARAATDPLEAVSAARALAAEDDVVVCTGSHYWLGDVYHSIVRKSLA